VTAAFLARGNTVRISDVRRGSPAARSGLRRGDCIGRIDGRPLRDFLDFYMGSFGSPHVLEVLRGGSCHYSVLRRGRAQDLGLEIERGGLKACGNRCVFCFVDQLPGGLRPALYFKDEDYRLSFLHGNYLTLTNLRPDDIARIAADHLSPLYVSVHATDAKLRGRLLGLRRPAPILDILKRLGRMGIKFHTQIVVVPGYNDGKSLDTTLRDLCALRGTVSSISVVPVGLTSRRCRLPAIEPVSGQASLEIVETVAGIRRRERRRCGRGMVYAADELFLRSGLAIPPASYYDDFPQIENGVGLARTFLDQIRVLRVPCDLKGMRLRLATGLLAKPLVERLATLLRRRGVEAETVAVENSLLGPSVTASGLLPGRALIQSLRGLPRCDVVALPPDVFSADGVTLDDFAITQIESALRVPVVRGSHDLRSTLKKISARMNSATVNAARVKGRQA